MILNQTPIRTSNNYEINNINIKNLKLPQNIKKFNNLSLTGDLSNFEISNEIKETKLTYGLGKELEDLCNKKANVKLKINEKKYGILNLNFNLDDENINLIENIEINLNTKSKTTIIIRYESGKELEGFHNGIIKVNSKKNSETDIILINNLNSKTYNFLSVENFLEENSKLNYTVVDFGGKTSLTNWYSKVYGNEAKANINAIYLGLDNQVFDINYISELYGKTTKTNIEVQGALQGESKKNFKGTIDFKRGCKKAKGNENEFCMLLSDKAKSKALPILLCTEEDIEGNHSTACGKIDNKELFYIMSRGLSYNEATKLIVKARFNNIINCINNEKIKEEILEEIEKRLN